MKVEKKSGFIPVVLTLETQEEVDCVYAFLRHVHCKIDGYEELEPLTADPARAFKELEGLLIELYSKRK